MRERLQTLLACIAVGCVARAQSESAESAQVARAQHRTEYNAYLASISTMDAPLPEGCGADEVLWHRESDVAFCTPLCGVDEDCLGVDERCIGPDYGLPSDGESVLWENVELSDGRIAYGICDPFASVEEIVLE